VHAAGGDGGVRDAVVMTVALASCGRGDAYRGHEGRAADC
jgi:hypothetical protein